MNSFLGPVERPCQSRRVTCLFENLQIPVRVRCRPEILDALLDMRSADDNCGGSMDRKLASQLQGGLLRQLSDHSCKETKQVAQDAQRDDAVWHLQAGVCMLWVRLWF